MPESPQPSSTTRPRSSKSDCIPPSLETKFPNFHGCSNSNQFPSHKPVLTSFRGRISGGSRTRFKVAETWGDDLATLYSVSSRLVPDLACKFLIGRKKTAWSWLVASKTKSRCRRRVARADFNVGLSLLFPSSIGRTSLTPFLGFSVKIRLKKKALASIWEPVKSQRSKK